MKVLHPPAVLLGPHGQSCGLLREIGQLEPPDRQKPGIPRDRKPKDNRRDDTHDDDPPGASAGGPALSPQRALDNPTCHRKGQARLNTHQHNQINTLTVPGSRYWRSAGTCEGASSEAYDFETPARPRTISGQAPAQPKPAAGPPAAARAAPGDRSRPAAGARPPRPGTGRGGP